MNKMHPYHKGETVEMFYCKMLISAFGLAISNDRHVYKCCFLG